MRGSPTSVPQGAGDERRAATPPLAARQCPVIWVAASLLVALGVAALLVRGRFATMVLDQPNERSLHSRPVPRTGGLAILAAIVATTPAWTGATLPILALALALGAASFLDDRRGLPVAVRFAGHLAAAAVSVWAGTAQPALAGSLAAVLAIAWMTNLYNFMEDRKSVV